MWRRRIGDKAGRRGEGSAVAARLGVKATTLKAKDGVKANVNMVHCSVKVSKCVITATYNKRTVSTNTFNIMYIKLST